MKKLIPVVFATLALLLSSCSGDSLKEGFRNPDDSYGIDAWWLWHNSYVSQDAMSREMHAMKDRHFHGFTIYDTGGHDQRGNRALPCGPMFGTDEWNDNMLHALRTADSLGMKVSLVIQSGWNLGGPMVEPVDMAKHVVFSTTEITGGKHFEGILPVSGRVLFDWYKDIAVLAFPLKDKTANGIASLNHKTSNAELGMSSPNSSFLLFNEEGAKLEKTWVASVEDIVDVSDKMDADGKLSWDAPAGKWAIVRVGYSPTGARVSTSADNWGGYAIDHLSTPKLDNYWNEAVTPVLDAAREFIPGTLQTIETDSWEIGGMNWTDDFREHFINYMGYDPVKYLVTAAGLVVGDEDTTSAFLADWRKAGADMIATRHYKHLTELAHENQLLTMPESAGPHSGPFDGIKNYGYNDILMSEFWAPSPHRPLPENKFFVKQASSAAHIYGKKIVNAEAFTTIGKNWNDTFWKDQKSAFDHEICSGMNRICVHGFATSPTEMGLPGAQSFAGTYFDSRNLWWEYSGPMMDYFRRVQYLAQNGSFVADVLYYYGDNIPNVYPLKEADMAGAMPGFDYDVTDETILLQLECRDGMVCTPSGMSYKVLALPSHQALSLEALEKVAALASEGAAIIGKKPLYLVSLKGAADAQKKFKALSDEIWGREDSVSGSVSYGKGNVAWGVTSREYLLSKGVKADFSVEGSSDGFDYIHYTIDGKDVYFISNQKEEERKVNCDFRVAGRQPEIWDALTGETAQLKAFKQADGLTRIPLKFEPCGSAIIVFDRKISDARCGEASVNWTEPISTLELKGQWTIAFDKTFGGPKENVVTDKLFDFTTSDIPEIKYFSGFAEYTLPFDLQEVPTSPCTLSLGNVLDSGMASVSLNDKDLGITWTAPFHLDVSGLLKEKGNVLKVTIVNSWFNRVAGEEMNPDMPKYTKTNVCLAHDHLGNSIDVIPLSPSGLIGPVTVEIY